MAPTQKFTNSGLVVYTKLSKNTSGLRKMNIDQIAIHCVAGNCTIEGLGGWFSNPQCVASSNYGIDSNGKIGLFVEEKNRSWCTSSAAVDERAITIEVANTADGEPWPVSEKAYAALIDLCVDICQRNNIKKLLWKADKSLLNQVDKQNMVPHRWTSTTGKSCPGNYLYEHFGDIAAKVNARLKTGAQGVSDTTKENLTKMQNDEYIWTYLRGKQLKDYAVAGIIANMYAESGLIPNNLENTMEKKLNMNDAVYTMLVDKKVYPNFATDGAGYGLCQWTYELGKKRLLDFSRERGKSVGSLQLQMEFFWWDLTTNFKTLKSKLDKVKSIEEATSIFLDTYEYGGKAPDSLKKKRTEYAKKFYNKFGTKNKNDKEETKTDRKVPYIVRVEVGELRIRKGAGTNYASTASIKDRSVYTIVQESTGPGAKLWGKLKSGAGWIALDYCSFVRNV